MLTLISYTQLTTAISISCCKIWHLSAWNILTIIVIKTFVEILYIQLIVPWINKTSLKKKIHSLHQQPITTSYPILFDYKTGKTCFILLLATAWKVA